jgi:hypothetical protein
VGLRVRPLGIGDRRVRGGRRVPDARRPDAHRGGGAAHERCRADGRRAHGACASGYRLSTR